MQKELTVVLDKLKEANSLLARYKKADADAAIFFGSVNENKIDG